MGSPAHFDESFQQTVRFFLWIQKASMHSGFQEKQEMPNLSLRSDGAMRENTARIRKGISSKPSR